ncbi:MAG TPA: RHS repeat-associated core domain-containing protein [Longimicrobium sp.]|nr:RHS repeat-associated core domain-containing protein [Longimicrobium sp.]
MPHPPTPRGRASLLAAPVLLALATLFAPAGAAAQCAEPGGLCGGSGSEEDFAPVLTLSPGSLTTAQRSVAVTISMSDDRGLADASFRVYAGGVDVTASFAYSTSYQANRPFPYGASATGTIQLPETGTVGVSAQICDIANQCTTSPAGIAYAVSRPGVDVTPDTGAVTVQAGARTQAFAVRNTGSEPATFRLRAECRSAETGQPAASGCSAPATVGPVAAGASATVQVSYTATLSNPLAVSLAAEQVGAGGVRDVGWMRVEVAAAGGGWEAPQARVVELNTGGRIERSQCVTASLGEAAAYECGDLRLVHALPGVTTMGRGRSPVLIYNSQHAHPMPTVYVDVTLPATASAPPQVKAVLTLSNGATYTRRFYGGHWSPGTTRRIAVQWDGLGMSTGVYGYTLQVTNVYSTVEHSGPSIPGEVTIVNRSQSSFGAGWWLAGMEQLVYLTDGSFLWVGGDGSTKRYWWTDNGIWRQWGVARPDSLWASGSSEGSYFWRRLPGGGKVWFNPQHRHWRTENTLQHYTYFRYTHVGLLDRLVVPDPVGGDSVHYGFSYGQYTNRLEGVNGPGIPGVTWGRRYVTVYGDGPAIDSILDPDGRKVRFGEDAARSYRVASRTNRAGVQTTFGWDLAGTLSSVSVWADDTTQIVSRFEAAEARGVHSTVPVGGAYTLLDGPRTDVADHTYLWLARFGAPQRIRDAAGGETVITRGDSRFAALPTEVIAPGGLKSTVTYDERARVTRSIVFNPRGDLANDTTAYTYDDLWNKPATVTAPGAGVSRFAYDPGNGNLLWQEVGDATRRVHFDYYPAGHAAAGQLMRVRQPHPLTGAAGGGGADSLAYDALGNLRLTRSPLGALALAFKDALGRDTLVVTPTDAASALSEAALLARGVRARATYDVMDRVTISETVGPAMTHASTSDLFFTPAATPQEEVVVETAYNEVGQPTSVIRYADPDQGAIGPMVTYYDYDRVGRKWRERNPPGQSTRYWHDRAGNVVQVQTGTQPIVSMQYDALGRLVRRSVPAVTHARQYDQIGLLQPMADVPFPRFPNTSGGGYLVPAEESFYRFDEAGNQVYAENGDAIVRRSYYPGGALHGDTLHLRDYGTSAFTQSYGLEYAYDRAGRLASMKHPQNLAAAGQALDQYAYHPVTGALSQATSRLGEVSAFGYDLLGRPVATEFPGFARDSAGYDLDGRRVWHRIRSAAGNVLLDEALSYDGRGKIVQAGNGASVFQQWYSGIGNLKATDWQAVGARNTEEYVMDALGNVTTTRTGTGLQPIHAVGNQPRYTAYATSLGRVVGMAKVVPPNAGTDFHQDSTAQWYDSAGNLVRSYNVARESGAGRESETRSFYGADNRLRATQRVAVRTPDDTYTPRFSGVWEEYRYDPLGRRVMVRTRTDGGLCDVDPWTCTGSITRFVWAGDQLLWELKAAGNAGANLEAVSGTGAAYGRVSYTHAGGIDRPLVITKDGASVVPQLNWRGIFAFGTTPAGAPSAANVDWPGYYSTPWHGTTRVVENWYGGLVTGMRDASGQIYMRNRYYDAKSGQFTQPDPIGLAGGLNSYGFAAGDPISYSDPYGLFKCPGSPGCPAETRVDRSQPGRLERWLGRNVNFGVSGTLGNRGYAVDLSSGDATESTVYGLPNVGGSGDLELGPTAAAGEKNESVDFGLGRHLGISFNQTQGRRGVRSVTLHLGVALPVPGATVTRDGAERPIQTPASRYSCAKVGC